MNRALIAMRFCSLALGFAALLDQPALGRDFCPDRPGVDTPPCTVEPGRISAEMSLGDWTRDSAPDALMDTILIGDLALRYGIADHAEVRFGWTAYGQARSRDWASGAAETKRGVGDVTFGIKRNLIDPEGKRFSIALLSSITLPTGGQTIGVGDWGATLLVPASVPLSAMVSLALTPEIDAAVDADRHGRHLAYGTAGGLAIAPVAGLNLAIEAAVLHDEDPAGTSTQSIAGVAAGMMLSDHLQLDGGTEIGLNSATPDIRVYAGIARKF